MLNVLHYETKDHFSKIETLGLTWSGFSPGGTQVYSSKAHPESSSEWANVCGRCPFCPLEAALVALVALVLLSMELLRVGWLAEEAEAWAAWAAMAALVAAAKGSDWRLKELLWSSCGHLQFWQRGLEQEIWFYNRCLWVICNNLYNALHYRSFLSHDPL